MYNKIYKYVFCHQKLSKKLNVVLKSFLGFKSKTTLYFTKKQLEAIRFYLLKKLKKIAIIFIKVNCLFPKTKKGIGIRMGKGAGNLDYNIVYIKQNHVFIEIFCLSLQKIKYTLKKLLSKLSINLILVQRLFFFKKI